jgi:hypothetical protein
MGLVGTVLLIATAGVTGLVLKIAVIAEYISASHIYEMFRTPLTILVSA